MPPDPVTDVLRRRGKGGHRRRGHRGEHLAKTGVGGDWRRHPQLQQTPGCCRPQTPGGRRGTERTNPTNTFLRTSITGEYVSVVLSHPVCSLTRLILKEGSGAHQTRLLVKTSEEQ